MAFSKNLKKKIRNLRSSKFNMIPQSPTLPVRSVMPEFDLGPMIDPRAPDSVAPQPVIPESIGGRGRGGFFSNIRQLPQFRRKGTMGRKLDRMFGGSRKQTPGRPISSGRLPRLMPERMPSRFPSGGLGSILERIFSQLERENESPRLLIAEDMPREVFPMTPPGFAEGDEVNMNMMMADQAARQGISPAEQRMMMIQKTAADMGRTISDDDAKAFGMGIISFEEAMSRAMPAVDMGQVAMERNMMQQEQLGFAEGGDVSRETNEIDSALKDIQSVQPEAMVIQQVMTMVMEMIQSGASEEQIVAALKEMGMDDEDIQQVMMMVASEMQGQDSIDGQLAQMM